MEQGVKQYDYWHTFFCFQVEGTKFCEETVSEHMLAYLLSGEMDLLTPTRTIHVKKGQAVFIRKNHLVKKVKRPGKNGEKFYGLFLQLTTPFLKKMLQKGLVHIPPKDDRNTHLDTYYELGNHPFLTGLFQSLDQYFRSEEHPSKELMMLKLEEAVLTLLQIKPQLGTALFDFAAPLRVSVADFMEKNYMCDLSLEQFAHFSGRSLSSFKKEFADTFHETPGHWIVRRRLQEARHLMETTHEGASEIYDKVGFKNLSHFSTAFKREYGFAPSALPKNENSLRNTMNN
ncbi:MAG: helix-turn-helix transcriptional regulator [Prevotella sp.]|jgi:AraC-like DNA-binding protein